MLSVLLLTLLTTSTVYYLFEKAKPESIIVELDFGINGWASVFFVAIEKGYYAEEGLVVDVRRGFGSSATIKSVQLGTADFGLADVSTLILLKANDPELKVRVVSQTVQSHALACFYIKGRGIIEPADLAGKKISVGEMTTVPALLAPGALRLMGVDPDTVTLIPTTGDSGEVLLARGDVDAAFDLIWSPSIYDAARNYSIPVDDVRYFLCRDYGFMAYMQGIVTSERMIGERPDVVRGFIRASLKAYRYTMEYPEEAMDILIKYHPEVPRGPADYRLRAQMGLWVSSDVDEYGLGYISREVLTSTLGIVIEAFKPTGTPPAVDDIYTDEFWTPGIMPPART